MTICPIAIAVGCGKCPAFKFCPLTTVLGDQQIVKYTITGNNTGKSVRSKLERLEKDFDIWEESYPPEKNEDNDDKKAGS